MGHEQLKAAKSAGKNWQAVKMCRIETDFFFQRMPLKQKIRWKWIEALTGFYLKLSGPIYYCAFKCYVVLEMLGINLTSSGTEREEKALGLSQFVYCKMTII